MIAHLGASTPKFPLNRTLVSAISFLDHAFAFILQQRLCHLPIRNSAYTMVMLHAVMSTFALI
jgi:hypothetical protein